MWDTPSRGWWPATSRPGSAECSCPPASERSAPCQSRSAAGRYRPTAHPSRPRPPLPAAASATPYRRRSISARRTPSAAYAGPRRRRSCSPTAPWRCPCAPAFPHTPPHPGRSCWSQRDTVRPGGGSGTGIPAPWGRAGRPDRGCRPYPAETAVCRPATP